MRTLLFLINLVGIFQLCRTQVVDGFPPPPPPGNDIPTNIPSGDIAYKATDQAAGQLTANELGAPPDVLIEPIQSEQPSIPQGFPNEPPPPPPEYNINGEINNQGNTVNLGPNAQISFPNIVPTPSGTPQFVNGQEPTISLKQGSRVVHEWLPTNIMQDLKLNMPGDGGMTNFNSLPPLQTPRETPAPSRSVTNEFQSQSGATLLDNGAYVLPGRGQFPPVDQPPEPQLPSQPDGPTINVPGGKLPSQPDTVNTPGGQLPSQPDTMSIPGGSGVVSGQSLSSVDPVDKLLMSQLLNAAATRENLPVEKLPIDLNNVQSLNVLTDYIKEQKRLIRIAQNLAKNAHQPVNNPTENTTPPPINLPIDNCDKFTEVPGFPKEYYEWVGEEVKRRECALGTAYNKTTCLCSDFYTSRPEKGSDCLPIFHAPLKREPRDISVDEITITNNNVAFQGSADFNGYSSMLTLWRFGGYDFQNSITISFEFKPNVWLTENGMLQPIISNCKFYSTGPDEGPSIYIAVTNGNKLTWRLQTKDSRGEISRGEINLYGVKAREWNKVILSYDGEIMVAVLNNQERDSYPLKGPIAIRHPPIVIGNCKKSWFRGYIRDVRIYDKCRPQV